MNKDNIFVIGFDKSGQTSNGSPSDFITRYEKVPGKPGSLSLVANYAMTESDKICQI